MDKLYIDLGIGRNRQSGFTLVEIMIVVAIIAILASIALPAYTEHVRKGHRAAAQSEMMDIANRQQEFFMTNRVYAESLGDLGYPALPEEVDKRYTADVDANNDATPPNFTITFSAKGTQIDDGDLALDSEGVKTPEEKW